MLKISNMIIMIFTVLRSASKQAENKLRIKNIFSKSKNILKILKLEVDIIRVRMSNDQSKFERNDVGVNTSMSFCCCDCAVKYNYLVNLCFSTAYSNRFLQELTAKDETMIKVSKTLGDISQCIHYIGSELVSHLLSQDVHSPMSHLFLFDPKEPSWKGDPSSLVLDGNKLLLHNIREVLEALKSHNHLVEKSLIKRLIRKTDLIKLWNDLESLLLSERSGNENDEDVPLQETALDVKNENEGYSSKLVSENLNEPKSIQLCQKSQDEKGTILSASSEPAETGQSTTYYKLLCPVYIAKPDVIQEKEEEPTEIEVDVNVKKDEEPDRV